MIPYILIAKVMYGLYKRRKSQKQIKKDIENYDGIVDQIAAITMGWTDH